MVTRSMTRRPAAHEADPTGAAVDFKGGNVSQDLEAGQQPEPLWEAMDCPDVTDDPFYDDFNQGE